VRELIDRSGVGKPEVQERILAADPPEEPVALAVWQQVRAGRSPREAVERIMELAEAVLEQLDYPPKATPNTVLVRAFVSEGDYSSEELEAAWSCLYGAGRVASSAGNFGVSWAWRLRQEAPLSLSLDDLHWLGGTGPYSQG
jgi:hypothetical protein